MPQRLDGYSSIGGPSLSGLTRLRADTLDVRSRATFQCPITGPSGSFNYVSANTIYAPTGTFGSLSVGKIYGPTGAFDYLSAGNGTINSLTTSTLAGSTGSFDYLYANTFSVGTFQSIANTTITGTIIGSDLSLSGNASISGTTSTKGIVNTTTGSTNGLKLANTTGSTMLNVYHDGSNLFYNNIVGSSILQYNGNYMLQLHPSSQIFCYENTICYKKT